MTLKKYMMLAGVALVAGCATNEPVNKEHDYLADRMLKSALTLKKLAPVSTIAGRDIGVKEGYAVQNVFNAKMADVYGGVTGYKVAYASKASQKKFGIAAPTFGTFFEKQFVKDGGTVQAESFMNFYNESEVAFTIAKDITKPVSNVNSLMPYLKSVHVGLDVPDMRFDGSKGKITVGDVIALSCATHTYVIGPGSDPKSVNYKTMNLGLKLDGKEVYSGAASNVMGDPREAVLILIKHLIEQGTYLKKGDVVLTGSVGKAYNGKEVESRRGKYVGYGDGLKPVTLLVK